jgi:hypothetical protein
VQIVLKTRAILVDLHLLIRDRASQVRKGLLELDVVLANILGPLLEGVLGIPVLLLQILEAIVVLQGIPEELPRVRGLDTAVGRLPRLVHTGRQGPWTTLQIGRCQSDIIRIWGSTQVVLNRGSAASHPRPSICSHSWEALQDGNDPYSLPLSPRPGC